MNLSFIHRFDVSIIFVLLQVRTIIVIRIPLIIIKTAMVQRTIHRLKVMVPIQLRMIILDVTNRVNQRKKNTFLNEKVDNQKRQMRKRRQERCQKRKNRKEKMENRNLGNENKLNELLFTPVQTFNSFLACKFQFNIILIKKKRFDFIHFNKTTVTSKNNIHFTIVIGTSSIFDVN
jgi:hypothetical protein